MICMLHCKENNASKVDMFHNTGHRATNNKIITKPFSNSFLFTICRCLKCCCSRKCIQQHWWGFRGWKHQAVLEASSHCYTCAHYCSLKLSLQSALGSGLPGKLFNTRTASLPCWTFGYRLSRTAALKMHLITHKMIFYGTILISTATWISIIEEWAYMIKWIR